MIITINDHPDIRRVFDGLKMRSVGINYTVGGGTKVKPSRELVNDHLNGAIPGSVYWSHPGIGLMEPPQDRPIGAT